MLHGFDDAAHRTSAWNHPERMNPPFQIPFFFFSAPTLLSVSLPLTSLTSPLSDPQGVIFLVCFSESCKGNLEGLSGINLKRMHLSLLLFLALMAHWFCSSGTCRLLILPPFPAPHHPATAAQSFCQSSPLKKKKKPPKHLLHFLRNDPLFLCL